MPQPSITAICLKIKCLKFHSNFLGANSNPDVLWNVIKQQDRDHSLTFFSHILEVSSTKVILSDLDLRGHGGRLLVAGFPPHFLNWVSTGAAVFDVTRTGSLGPTFINSLVNGRYGCNLNSLAPGRFQRNFRKVIFQLILVIDGWSISCKIVLKWMPMDFTNGKSTLV